MLGSYENGRVNKLTGYSYREDSSQNDNLYILLSIWKVTKSCFQYQNFQVKISSFPLLNKKLNKSKSKRQWEIQIQKGRQIDEVIKDEPVSEPYNNTWKVDMQIR